jgi:pilus assembly protein CpaB
MQMNQISKNWLLAGMALTFGCISAWAINRHLTNKTLEIESRSRQQIVTRIVAAQELKKGSTLTMNDLAVREFNDPLLGLAAVDPSDVDLLVGKVLKQDVNEGQLIPLSIIADRLPNHLVSKLESGMRAVTIPVDQINSMSGLLNPADRIDLLVSFEHQGQRITSPLLANIEVIATGQETTIQSLSTSEAQPSYETVTLATTADQAVKLVAARQAGTITAVLSQTSDRLPVDPIGKNQSGHLAKLLGLEEQRAEPIPVIYGDRSDSMMTTDPDHDIAQRHRFTTSEGRN